MFAKNSAMRNFAIVVMLICFGVAGTAHADLWTYEYRLRTYAEANPIKNLLIQLTDGTTVGNISTSSVDGGAVTYSTGTFGSTVLQGFPLSSLYGINFQVPYGANHDFSIKFDSSNAPVWGDFYAKDWDYAGLAYAYNNRDKGFFIPRPDNGGASVPAINWVGSITNIDGNNVGAGGPLINSDSPLYAAGDRWYYQANDAITGGYKDFGWVEFSWKISPSSVSVSEPATMLLLGCGLIGLAGLRRKFKR